MAFWTSGRRLGWSPNVWQDTTIEDDFIRRCLEEDHCTMAGVGATVGIQHSAGYLHFRELLAAMGFDADRTHLVLFAGTALAVTLVAFVARVYGGRVASALAAVLMATHVGLSTQLDVVTDLAPMPMLGAIFLVTALAALEARHLGLTALMGLVAAVAANCYATGLLLGGSAAWVALLMKERRWTHLAVAVGSFAAATFAIAPGTWLGAYQMAVHHRVGNGNPVVAHSAVVIPAVGLAVLAAGVWGAAAIARWPLRARLDVPTAIILPLLLPLALGSVSGQLDPQAKYCSQMVAAISFALAIAAVDVGQWAWRGPLRPLHDKLPSGAASASLGKPLSLVALALALLVVDRRGMAEGLQQTSNFSEISYGDLAAVKQALGHDRSWTRARVAHDLKIAHNLALPVLLQDTRGWPETGPEDNLERAYVIKTPLRSLPSPLPDGVVRVRDAMGYATLVAITCSWIDWRDFRACVKRPGVEGEVCTRTGLPDGLAMAGAAVVPGMPEVDARHLARQTVTVHFPLHPRADCPAMKVVMAYVPPMCLGKIASVDGVEGQVDPEGKWAHMRVDPAHPVAGAELSVVWELGTSTCWNEYRGTVPYMLEGAPSAIDLLQDIVEENQ